MDRNLKIETNTVSGIDKVEKLVSLMLIKENYNTTEYLSEFQLVGDECEQFISEEYCKRLAEEVIDILFENRPIQAVKEPEPFRTYSPFGDIYKQVMGYN